MTRDCKHCKHYVLTDTRTNWGDTEPTKIYSCEKWECHFEAIEETDNINRAAAIKAINNVQVNFHIASRHNLAYMRKEIQMIIDEVLKAQTEAINKLPKQL